MHRLGNGRWFFWLCLIGFSSCENPSEPEAISKRESRAPYQRSWVGDIEHNENFDTLDFEICGKENTIKQYFNFSNGFQYEGEKFAILQSLAAQNIDVSAYTDGYVRVRFIVNCRGNSGRFRVNCFDKNLEPMDYPQALTHKLVSFVQSLDGWKKQPNETNSEDFYQYLTFKIASGKISEVLP